MLNRQEIEDLVIDLYYNKKKTFREIQKIVRKSLRDIKTIKDLDLESKPAKVFVRGEYTKTKIDRVVFLTEEVTQQLRSWLTYKYRKRRVCYKGEKYDDHQINGKTTTTITEYRTPDRKENDLVFAVYQNTKLSNPDGIYDDIAKSFAKTLDRMGKGDREDGNENRRQSLQ